MIAMAVSLAACGEDSGRKTQEASGEAARRAEAAMAATEPERRPSDASNAPEATDAPEATIEEAVLLDEAGIRITAKSLEIDTLWGTELKTSIADSYEYSFDGSGDVSINGFMADPAAGGSA